MVDVTLRFSKAWWNKIEDFYSKKAEAHEMTLEEMLKAVIYGTMELDIIHIDAKTGALIDVYAAKRKLTKDEAFKTLIAVGFKILEGQSLDEFQKEQ